MRYHFEKEEFPEISAAQYIIYEDGDASQLTQFANASFGILLMTIQSFNKFNTHKNKDNNIIYQKNHEDSTNGRPLIELVREMHPVVIVDEPAKTPMFAGSKGLSPLAGFGAAPQKNFAYTVGPSPLRCYLLRKYAATPDAGTAPRNAPPEFIQIFSK